MGNIKQFCEWHIKTQENPEGTDCSAHLADGRIFKCPYNSPEDIQETEFPCVDYRRKSGTFTKHQK